MLLVSAFRRELDVAVRQREQGVILADTNVFTRVHTRAALAHDDAASVDRLAAVHFDAEALRLGIAPVAGRPACFFVCGKAAGRDQ